MTIHSTLTIFTHRFVLCENGKLIRALDYIMLVKTLKIIAIVMPLSLAISFVSFVLTISDSIIWEGQSFELWERLCA